MFRDRLQNIQSDWKYPPIALYIHNFSWNIFQPWFENAKFEIEIRLDISQNSNRKKWRKINKFDCNIKLKSQKINCFAWFYDQNAYIVISMFWEKNMCILKLECDATNLKLVLTYRCIECPKMNPKIFKNQQISFLNIFWTVRTG